MFVAWTQVLCRPLAKKTMANFIEKASRPMYLKDRVGDVETDCRNRLHGYLLRNVGVLNSAHIFGTLVPVEEPVHSKTVAASGSASLPDKQLAIADEVIE